MAIAAFRFSFNRLLLIFENLSWGGGATVASKESILKVLKVSPDGLTSRHITRCRPTFFQEMSSYSSSTPNNCSGLFGVALVKYNI